MSVARTQLGQYAHEYLVEYAGERLDVEDFTPEQREWIDENAAALTRSLEQAVEGYIMDVDEVPGEELPT